MIAADKLIQQSAHHNDVVHVSFDLGLAVALRAVCEDSIATTTRIEFWGTTEDGDEWRIHMAQAEVQP